MSGFDEGELLDLIYGAAVKPALWAPAMERLADAVGGNIAFMSRLNVVDGRGSVIAVRTDPAMIDLYFAHYAGINPLNNVSDPRAFMRGWAPRILSDEDWMEKEALVGTEFYNDFMRPQGAHAVLMIRLAAEGLDTCVMNVNRPPASGPFQRRERELAARLRPHLARAFRLGQALQDDRRLDAGAAGFFDASPHGLFLLDDEARVRRLNAAGEALVGADKGLTVRGGRLRATAPEAARRLSALIGRAAARAPSEREAGSMGVPQSSGATPLAISVAPIRVESVAIFDHRPWVLVCVTDPDAVGAHPERTLRAVFGLTPAEARVALALFGGATPREAATQLGISANTVRVHLSHIFEKTGANRQSALVKLLFQIVGPGTP